MHGKTYSTGSSIVITLRDSSAISVRVAYSVVVLPLPVGPAHSTMPKGRSHEGGVGVGCVLGHAELAQAEDGPCPVEEPHDALLAPDRGHGGDTHVDFFAVDLRAQLAVLWPASLDDVHSGHDLDAADQPDAHGRGERQHLFERAVDPVADPDAQFGGLDVDVGRPVTHGLGQDATDDLDDGRVVGHHVGRQSRCVRRLRLRVPSTASKAWTRWSRPPMAR